MAFATATDIEDRLGRSLDTSEARIVETRLADVEILIEARLPDLATKLAESATFGRLVVMVEADAVLRLIRNPDGFTEELDGNYSYKIDARVASGRLALLPEEWDLLGVRRAVYVLAPKIVLPFGRIIPNPNYAFEQGQEWSSSDTAVWG